MTWHVHLEADCEVLSERLRKRNVPRDKRSSARKLLSRIFALQSLERTPDQEDELRTLSLLVEKLAYPQDTNWSPRMLQRVSTMTPVRLRFAVSHLRVRQLHERYLGRAERLEAVVAWFWQRCAPEHEVTRALSVQEKALDEFAGEDLEFVWGRRKIPSI
jgi:hypothetical protein